MNCCFELEEAGMSKKDTLFDNSKLCWNKTTMIHPFQKVVYMKKYKCVIVVVFFPFPHKGHASDCSNYFILVLGSRHDLLLWIR